MLYAPNPELAVSSDVIFLDMGFIAESQLAKTFTEKFPFMNSVQRSGCCLSVFCIIVMYRWSKQA